MRFIGSTAFMKNDLEEALRILAGIGFKEVDLIAIGGWNLILPENLVKDFDSEAGRIERALEKAGVRAVSMNTAFSPQLFDREDEAQNEARRQQVHAVCRLMKRLGIEIAAHYPGHIADWKNDPEGVFAGSVESLKEIQGIAGEHGVTLAPEIHFNTPFEKPDDARRMKAEIPGIPYTYEPSHFIVRGLDYTQTRDLLDGASHCHFRTCDQDQIQADLPAGLNALDWMVQALRERDYQGIVSIEFLPGAEFDSPKAIAALKERYAG